MFSIYNNIKKEELENLYNEGSLEIMKKVDGNSLKDKIANLYYSNEELKKICI